MDPSSIEWNFEKIRPDIIVINLGTNDSSYCGEDMERHSEFKDGYINLLKMVREKNPEADIICTVGILGGKIIYQDIEEAAADYIKETVDSRISCMEFDFTLFDDGMTADYHPREITHQKSAKQLIYKIGQLI